MAYPYETEHGTIMITEEMDAKFKEWFEACEERGVVVEFYMEAYFDLPDENYASHGVCMVYDIDKENPAYQEQLLIIIDTGRMFGFVRRDDPEELVRFIHEQGEDMEVD